MASQSLHLTFRDFDLLTAIERCPLTVRQIRALSHTFHSSFGSERRLQDRLAILTRADLLRRFRYAATDAPGRYYYMLSPECYRMLHGDEPLPSPGIFREVAIARQHHTHRLADCLVKTLVATRHVGLEMRDFARENALKLSVADDCLYPDSSFTLVTPDGRLFQFYVELDNSTEPVASPRERDSWLRKIQFYERLQDESPSRFRVLALVTKSPQRIRNILAMANSLARNPQRSLLYSVFLPEYLDDPMPLTVPIFTDHRDEQVSLVPAIPQAFRPENQEALASAMAV